MSCLHKYSRTAQENAFLGARETKWASENDFDFHNNMQVVNSNIRSKITKFVFLLSDWEKCQGEKCKPPQVYIKTPKVISVDNFTGTNEERESVLIKETYRLCLDHQFVEEFREQKKIIRTKWLTAKLFFGIIVIVLFKSNPTENQNHKPKTAVIQLQLMSNRKFATSKVMAKSELPTQIS